MALSKGNNSYSTVVEADIYFEDRLDVAAWDQDNDAQKAKALVTATLFLDGLEWPGTAVSTDQPLAFPRNGEYYEPRTGFMVAMNPVPDRIIKATFEQAYHILNNDGLFDETGQVKDLEIGGVKMTSLIPAQKLSPVSARLLKPLLATSSGRNWWRAN
jgi:hypothetical protein